MGFQPALVTQRATTFSELNHRAGTAIAELVTELETWAIAIPGWQVFRTALDAASFDLQTAFGAPYEKLLLVLPLDPLDGRAFCLRLVCATINDDLKL